MNEPQHGGSDRSDGLWRIADADGVELAAAAMENRKRPAPAGLLRAGSDARDWSETRPVASSSAALRRALVALCVSPVFNLRAPGGVLAVHRYAFA